MPLREKLALVVGLGLLGFVPVGYLVGGEDFRLWWHYGSQGRPIHEEGLEKLAEIERVQARRGLGAMDILEIRRALPQEFWRSEAWPEHTWRFGSNSAGGFLLAIGNYAPSEEHGDEFELWYHSTSGRWHSQQ